MPPAFEITAVEARSAARCGRLSTGHGVVETPAFMPVGTQGTVKCMAPWELRELGAGMILSNTYHLMVRPGLEVVEAAGGVHPFMGWDGPILTDSGGYQVFSLAKLRKISDDGVEFQSHVDGAKMFLGPREAMAAQAVLGSDVAMAFDECPHWPCDREYACGSLTLTLKWAARCREIGGGRVSRRATAEAGRQLLFGIVQGSVYPELRERSARELVAMEFDGYAVGGVSVGETEELMFQQVDASVPFLPLDRPRYVMGVGKPPQLLAMIARGVDLFDCVLPTRVARNGTVFTRRGCYSIRNAAYRMDFGPLEPGCGCGACRQFTRAYVRHLTWANEVLGLRLLTTHNLHVYLELMRQTRAAIAAGEFEAWRQELTAGYATTDEEGAT